MSVRKVLVIDDDEHMRTTLGEILELHDFTPLVAADAAAGVALAREAEPAVALIDLVLGDDSGLDVLREIRNVSPKTKCIVLTGRASQESAIRAVELGAYSYIQKAQDMDQLLVTISRAAEKVEAEEGLREIEKRFRSLVEKASDDLFEIEPEDIEEFLELLAELRARDPW